MREGSSLMDRVAQSRVWRSIFRQGYPNTLENQSKVIVNSWFLHLHPVKVRRHTLKVTYTFGLGIISFFLFAVLVVTGAWLMLFHVPSVERAYASIQFLHADVTFGTLMRNMHRWAAHLMVLTVFLHLCRVFFTGGYKQPREFNWAVGVVLWMVTLLLSFTGYLLPWDQLSYWAITVGTNMVGSTPWVGEEVRLALLGAREVGSSALTRFYALHIAILPLMMTILIGVHFWRIRKDGGLSSPAEGAANSRQGGK